MYALVAEAPPTRYPLMASTLAGALKQNLPCIVILPGQPDDFIERIARFGQFDMQQALVGGQIQIFTMQENFAKSMFRFGAETFCHEMGHFQIPDGSLLIFEQADDLLSLHDVSLAMSQVSVLRHWFHEHNVTVILSFARIASSSTALAALQCLMDQLGGICRIGGHRDGLEITFDYWHSPEGTVAAKSYPLQTQDSGMLVASPNTPANQSGSVLHHGQQDWPEDAEQHFFFMDPDLISLSKQMPGVWQHVDSLVGMMHATRDTHSSTVILSFKRDTEIRQLAQTVHTLRHGLGPRARIVVQEKNASLRYQNEALLLRLGLNLVIHVDVPGSRLPLLLSSLNGQIFDRDIDINFEMALASVTPSGMKGYVLPTRFVSEAGKLLERAETLDIPCALVLGMAARDVSAGDLLAQMLMSRGGDLVTFDQQCCYLFLNGCPESSLLMTLERVLGQGVGAAFVESRFVVRRHEILAELAALTRAAERFILPDYSDLPMRAPPAPRSAPAVAPVPAPAPARPSAVARPAPARPQHPPASEPAHVPERAPARPLIAPVHHEQANDGLPIFRPLQPLEPVAAVVEALVEPMREPAPETVPASPAIVLKHPEPVAASADAAEVADDAEGKFHYGGELGKVVAFGKKQAPRAMRAVKKA
jgi:cellulose biosynthesis protein BcsE